MDDDLGTPAAVAAIYDVVREGNKLLADGDSPALRGAASSVRGDARGARARPVRPALGRAASSRTRGQAHRGRRRARVASLLEQRAAARAAKDFATADAIRDQLKAAGIELEDTPQGPTWSL